MKIISLSVALERTRTNKEQIDVARKRYFAHGTRDRGRAQGRAAGLASPQKSTEALQYVALRQAAKQRRRTSDGAARAAHPRQTHHRNATVCSKDVRYY
jgi:hypothetical protein